MACRVAAVPPCWSVLRMRDTSVSSLTMLLWDAVRIHARKALTLG